MRFEKWQALGNDYLIFEEVELSPNAGPRLCDPHFGPGADGVLVLTKPDEPGFVARLRIFNPDGSEAELSGNGAREAILYLRRSGWTDADTFSIQTLGGRDPPDDHEPDDVHASTWAARTLTSPNYPEGPPDGQGELEARATSASSTSRSATRSARSASSDPDAHRPAAPSARRSSTPRSSRTARTCQLLARARAGRDPRADLRARRGGDAVAAAPGRAARRWRTSLRGGDSPVTVHLDGGELTVDVDESLHVDLTGWAKPIYRGELSEEFKNDMEAE